jgi:hypothetical protein
MQLMGTLGNEKTYEKLHQQPYGRFIRNFLGLMNIPRLSTRVLQQLLLFRIHRLHQDFHLDQLILLIQLQYDHHHMQLLILFRDVLQNPSHQSHFRMSLQSRRRRYVEPTRSAHNPSAGCRRHVS